MMPHPYSPPAEEAAEAAVKAKSAHIRFKQQIFMSVGSGMIFALVGAIAAKLLSPSIAAVAAGTTTASVATATVSSGLLSGLLLPALGILAVAAIGLGCVYIGSHFLSEVVALDQSTEAKKIGAASRGHVPDISPGFAHPEPSPAPISGMDTAAFLDEVPSSRPNTRIEAATVQRFEPSLARGESAATTGTDVSWAARMAANDDKATVQAVGA